MSAAEKIDTDLEAFRAEARAWLEKNFPPSLKGRAGMMMGEDGPDASADFGKWKKAMGEKGWGTPTYPKQYGGGGLSQSQSRVLQQEMNRIGAWNPIGGMGVMMFGPTLLEYGSEEQKKKHVPGIVKGEVGGARATPNPAPAPISHRCARNASTRAIIISSTGRRSGPAGRSSPTCVLPWSEPTTQGSMKAFRSC
jgi:alkylation response protein AidB-like acyl-CoA dehydrogenase